MDNSAIDLCRTNKINIVVFDINKENNLVNAVLGKNVGTIIS